MPCIISDTLNAIDGSGSLVGLGGRPVIARATNAPLSITFDNGATWHELQGNEIRTLSNEDGSWSLTLFAHAEEDPATTDWQITLPDGITWSGTIPAGVPGPVSIKTLKTSYGWVITNSTTTAILSGACQLISDNLLTAPQASPWTIPITAGYKHVIAQVALRSTDTVNANGQLSVQMNGKTTGYDRLDAGNSTYLNSPAVYPMDFIPCSNAPAGAFATGSLKLLNADQAATLSIYTEMISLYGATPSLARTIQNGFLTQAGALTSITLILNNGSFTAGSRVTLYGYS